MKKHKFISFINNHKITLRSFSIKHRLFLVFFLQILILLSWCNYVIFTSFKEYKTYIYNSNERIIYNITENFQSYIKGLENVSKFPIDRSPNSQPSYIYTYLSNYEDKTMERYLYYHEVQTTFQKLLNLYPFISTIVVYDINGDGIFVEKNTLYMTVKNQSATEWFNDSLLEKGRMIILNSDEISGLEISDNSDMIAASRAIVNAENYKNIGSVLVSVDTSSLKRFFNSNRVFDNQRISVYTLDGKKLFGDIDTDTFNTVLSNIKDKKSYEDDSFLVKDALKLKIRGTSYIYNYSTFYGKYLCILETPNHSIIETTLNRQFGVFIILVLLILLTIILLNLILKSIIKPLSKLVKACDKISSGNFSFSIPEDGNDELAHFTHSFNTMIKRINILIQEVYVKDTVKAQIELQMLMSQINPHFLYNTLENIQSAAYIKGEQNISEMASLLGKILRFGISVSDKLVTIDKELETLGDYIKLQKLRYGDKINFIINVDNSILQYKIVKLILQPIVENSIYHGINTLESNGTIHILGFIDGYNIIFKVIDNGLGIDNDVVEKLNDYINDKNQLFKSIGLKNVHRRIQLYYGKEYGINIESIYGKGTIVTAVLPCDQDLLP